MAIVFNMMYSFSRVAVFICSPTIRNLYLVAFNMTTRVIKMISCAPKSVNLKFREEILWDLLKEEIDDHTTLDSTLRMHYKD
jgi:hypothetical protein